MPSENTYNSWIKQFPIGSVYRFDLQRIGCTTEQIDALSDMDMLAIANKMQSLHLESDFWKHLALALNEVLQEKEQSHGEKPLR